MIARTDPRTPLMVLVGPPGAGKSTIGRKLARELGVELHDTDTAIEHETGRTIPEIFATDGEPEFRRIEERVVRRAVLTEHGVVSLGGGAILSDNTRALLRHRTVVYLEISVSEGIRRTGTNTQRPLLNGGDPGAKYRELMRERRPLYREVATIRVRTDGRSPSRVVRTILTKLDLEPVTPDPDTTSEAAPSRASKRSRARRRTRHRRVGTAAAKGAADHSGSTASAAPASRSTDAVTTDPSRIGGHATGSGGASDGRRRSRRARRPAGAPTTDIPPVASDTNPGRSAKPANPEATSKPGATGETSKPTPESGDRSAGGRTRRGRARRGRGRASQQSPPRESEHS